LKKTLYRKINFCLSIVLFAFVLFNLFYITESKNSQNLLKYHYKVPSIKHSSSYIINEYKVANKSFEEFFYLFSHSRLVIDTKDLKPSFADNYLAFLINLFIKDKIINYCPLGILKKKGGLCDDASFLLMNYAAKKNLQSKLVQLNGHVVLEVLYNNGNIKTYDSANNLIFDYPVLKLDRMQVKNKLKKYSTLNDFTIEKIVDIYMSKSDNAHNNAEWYYKSCQNFTIVKILSIIIPFLLLFIHFLVLKK